jgi:NAD(P)-dependent dehydrogenase (short-subunit alcohol dehydrogenase family)
LATAQALVGLGARVGIVGRDPQRLQAAVEQIGRRHPRATAVDLFMADLCSQSEVRALAAAALDTYVRLDVLVNNVGGFWAHRHRTVDGLERTFAVNHLAPFLLTNLLLDRLKWSAPARIVTVASNAHALGRLDLEDLQGEVDYSGPRAYNQSKLANILFTRELARRLAPSVVTANAVHPGMVRTSFGAEDQVGAWRLVAPVVRPFMSTPARGAATTVHLASSRAVAGLTGGYYARSRTKRPSASATSAPDARRLWEVSADLVGLGG